MYHPELSSAMSHTYINQYAGSEYHLDRVQTPQMPYMPFEIDTGYEEYNHSMYHQNAGYDKDSPSSFHINIESFNEIREFVFFENILILMSLDFWLQVTADAIRRDRVLEANSSRKSCLYRLDGRLTLRSVAGSITSITIPKPRIGRIRLRRKVYPQDGRESSRLNMEFIMSSESSYEKKRRQFSHNYAHYNNYFFFF